MSKDIFILAKQMAGKQNPIVSALLYDFCPGAAHWYVRGAEPEEVFDIVWKAFEDYATTVAGNDSVGVADPAPQTIILEGGESAVASFDLEVLEVGSGELTVTLAGPDGWQVERTTMLGVRPAQLPTLDRVAYRLEPGETLTVGSDIASRFIPGSGEVLVTFGDRPNIDGGIAAFARPLSLWLPRADNQSRAAAPLCGGGCPALGSGRERGRAS